MFKPRTKLGKWLDQRGITQQWLSKQAKVNRNTVSELCNNPKYSPTLQTVKKVIVALKKIDPSINADHFFDI